MTKNRMGRRSHHAIDAEYQQNLSQVDQDIPSQPTRPTLGKHQVSKTSKEMPKPDK